MLAMLLAFGSLILPWPVALAATAEVTFSAAASVSSLREGEQVTITISGTAIQDFGGAVLNFAFDPAKLECKSITNTYAAYCASQASSTGNSYWRDIAGSISSAAEANAAGRISLQILNTASPLTTGYTIPAMEWFSATFEIRQGAPRGAISLGIDNSAAQTGATVATLNAQNAPQEITVRTANATITIADPPLSGTLTLSGNAKLNQSLSAQAAQLPVDASPLIQWYRDDAAIPGATGASYTTAAADIGKTITAKMTAAGYSGAVASSNSIGPIGRGDRAAPAVPQEVSASRTNTQVVLQAIAGEGLRYGCSTQNDAASISTWQESAIFTGLSQNTTYYFFAKYLQTANYNESPASASLAVTTNKTAFTITMQAGEAGGGTAEYAVVGGGGAVEGASIQITAAPDASHFFAGWQSSPAIAFEDAGSPQTGFSMPAANVVITAQFAQKYAITIQAAAKEATYTGSAIAIATPDVVDAGGCGDVSPSNLRIAYARRPDGIPTEAAPTNAGVYDVSISYAGDALHLPAAASTTLTINQAAQAAPAAPGIVSAAQESILYATQSAVSYLLLPASDSPPSISTSGWRAGNGQQMSWTHLQPGTAYTLYAHYPASGNHSASPVSPGTAVTTLHAWALEATLDGRIASSVAFYAKTNYIEAPEAKEIRLENTGTGDLSDISVQLDGSGAAQFTLDTLSLSGTLASGNTTSFTIRPKTGAASGSYTAQILIHAKQHSPDTSETGAIADIQLSVALHVTDKIVVTISGLTDKTTPYNGAPQGISTALIATSVPDGDASFPAEDLTFLYTGEGYSSATPPTKAGVYTLTAAVPDDNASHVGAANATLSITKAALMVQGLTVTEKIYDGSLAATITGGTLAGICGEDAVSILGGMPTSGQFASRNQSEGIPVSIAPLALTGADAGNYMLLQPSVSGKIKPRSVKPTVTVLPRTYDGTAAIAASQISAVLGGQVVSGDSISIAYAGAQFPDKKVGNNKQVTLGTYVVTGNGFGNYAFLPPDTVYANITPLQVDVTVSGNAAPVYDGQPKPLYASYPALGSDTQSVLIQYNGSSSAPVLAGTYNISVQLYDTNYTLGNMLGLSSMTISPGLLAGQAVTMSIAAGDSGQKGVQTSQFTIAAPEGAAVPTGTYSLDTPVDSGGILDGAPTINGNTIVFRLKQSVQAGAVAAIPVIYTPTANTYAPFYTSIQIAVGEEGYTNSVVNAPATVRLGDAIDFSSVRLRTVFESGQPAEEIGESGYSVFSEYDPLRTGPGSIGSFTITLTHNSNPLRTASFTIQALDVVTGISVTPPAKLQYTWRVDTALSLTGGMVAKSMRSGIPQPGTPLTAAMLRFSSSALTALGTYPVDVVYDGITKESAFFIRVVQPPISIIGTPGAGQPGIIGLDPSIYFTAVQGGQAVPSGNVQLVITEAQGQALLDLQIMLAQQPAFAGAGAMYMDIRLVDVATGALVRPSSAITVQLPYPSGMGASDLYLLLHKSEAGGYETIPVSRTANGLVFQAVDISGSYALAYRSAPPDPGNPDPGDNNNPGGNTSEEEEAQRQQDAFWNEILRYIQSAQKGSTVRASAGSYDKLPVAVMQALRNADSVTLIISWNGGADITVTSANAPKPESNRVFYPLSSLQSIINSSGQGSQNATESGSAGSSGSGSGSSGSSGGNSSGSGSSSSSSGGSSSSGNSSSGSSSSGSSSGSSSSGTSGSSGSDDGAQNNDADASGSNDGTASGNGNDAANQTQTSGEGEVTDVVAPEEAQNEESEATPGESGTFDLMDTSGQQGQEQAPADDSPPPATHTEEEDASEEGGFSSSFELIAIIATVAISGACAVLFGRKFLRQRKRGS